MKSLYILVILISVTFNAKAQLWNPFVNSIHISESPIDLTKGEFVDLKFNIGNGGSQPLDNLNNPLRALVTLNGFQPANLANPQESISGNTFFQVSYIAEISTFYLEQINPMPAALNGGVNTITIRVRVTNFSTIENPRNGFQVNVTPPAYTSSSNNINDDRSEIITYTLNSLLPVELVQFSAEVVDCNVLINWKTASELNNDYFLIEKSEDAIQWTSLGKVSGHGNSQVPQNYEWKDIQLTNQETYYRLVQFDYDGTQEISHIVSVNAPSCFGQSYKVYPNPAQDVIYVEYENPIDTKYESILFSASGQLVKTASLSGMNSRIYVGDLVPGAYLLQMKSTENLYTHPIVIQR